MGKCKAMVFQSFDARPQYEPCGVEREGMNYCADHRVEYARSFGMECSECGCRHGVEHPDSCPNCDLIKELKADRADLDWLEEMGESVGMGATSEDPQDGQMWFVRENDWLGKGDTIREAISDARKNYERDSV